jgi:hypothetical protein
MYVKGGWTKEVMCAEISGQKREICARIDDFVLESLGAKNMCTGICIVGLISLQRTFKFWSVREK